jgi:hypothetical protein
MAAFRLVLGFVSACFNGNEKPWKPFAVFVVPVVIIELSGPRTLSYVPPIAGIAIQTIWLILGIWVVLSVWRCAKNASANWVAVWRIAAVICAIPAIAIPTFFFAAQLMMYLP